MLYKKKFELQTCLKMSPLNLDVSQPPKIFIAKENIHKSWQYLIIVLLISRLSDIVQKFFRQHAASIYGFVRQSVSQSVLILLCFGNEASRDQFVVGRLVGRLVGWLVGWLAGWLAV